MQPDLRDLLDAGDSLRLFAALALAPDPRVSGPARLVLLGIIEAEEAAESEDRDAA